tara:strand:+ start:484 stop:786 length:303 start_codon:yes stop_codon:yes gene_type:complete
MKNLEKLSEKLIELGIDVERFYNPTEFSKTPHGKAIMMEDIIIKSSLTFGRDFINNMLMCIEDNETLNKEELVHTIYHDLFGGFNKDMKMLPRVQSYSNK